MENPNEYIISDEQLLRVAKRLTEQHVCRFSDTEARDMHEFARLLSSGGIDRFRGVLAFEEYLQRAKKTGSIAFVIAMVSTALGLLWIGIQEAFKRGGIH